MANNSSITPGISSNEREAFLWWYGVSCTVSGAGVLSAILLICALLRHQPLREGAHLLVIGLLILDTVAALPSCLFTTTILSAQLGHAPPLPCVLVQFPRHLIFTAVHWIATALALNRFVAILLPHRYPNISSRRATAFLAAVCCIIACVATVPFVTDTLGYYAFSPVMGSCVLIQYPHPLVPLLLSLSVTVPFCLQGGLYFCVLANIFRSCQKHVRETATRSRQRTIAVMLMGSFIWYIVCYCPLPIIATHLPMVWRGRPLLFFWLNSLTHFGSAGTPAIYILLSGEYRRAVLLTVRAALWRLSGERLCATASQTTRSTQAAANSAGKVSNTR
ncbi:allatostatin-A receptor-like [Paramacrobiotus metropolitanus]|uniref:allatostatin-A receptor-like n=1 Tax=Paramacrobiotus metropolitanus TaxID=2943436 RepID=UPI0024456FA4|nr:allatostatin-A receptor-like [Paramacrobiotus metropolitanus]